MARQVHPRERPQESEQALVPAKTYDEYDHISGMRAQMPTARPPLTEPEMTERRENMLQAIRLEREALSLHLVVTSEDLAAAGIEARAGQQFDVGALINADLARIPGQQVGADVLRFISGDLSMVAINISSDSRTARRQEEAIKTLETLIGYYSSVYDIPPFQLTREGDMVVLVNNWYVPFSGEQKREIETIMMRAEYLDFDQLVAFTYVYDQLKDIARESANIRASASMSGMGDISDLLANLSATFDDAQSDLMQCLRDISEGSPRTQAIDAAYQSIHAVNEAYHAAWRAVADRIGEIGEAMIDVDELSQDVNRSMPVIPSEEQSRLFGLEITTTSCSFSDMEKSFFGAVRERWQQLRDRIEGLDGETRLNIAAAMLGIPQGTVFGDMRISAPDSGIADVFGEFMSMCGVLALFAAKARYGRILTDYVEYLKAYVHAERQLAHYGADDTFLLELAATGSLPGRIDSEAVRRFITNREAYTEELNSPEFREKLKAYGDALRNTLSVEMRSAGFLELYSSEQIDTFLAPLEEDIEEPWVPDEMAGMPDGRIAPMLASISHYMRAIQAAVGNVESAAEELASQQYDWALQERYRNGDLWDKFYSFSKYFMKYGASDFLFWSSIALLGAGVVARGATLGLDFMLGAAGRGAVRSFISRFAAVSYQTLLSTGFRYATTATALAGAPVYLNAMRYMGGNRSDEVYEDLNLMGLFLLMRGAAGTAPVGRMLFARRAFAASATALGTAAAGTRIFEDIRRGETWQAIFDSVVFATGGAMFIKSVSGMLRFSDATGLTTRGASVATASGFAELSFGKWGERVFRAASYPYTGKGFLTFYGMHMGFQMLRTWWLTVPPTALAYAEDGISGLREYFSATYAAAGNAMPFISIAFSALEAGLGAVAGRGGGTSVREITLQVPPAEQPRTIIAAELGATETAEQALSGAMHLDAEAAAALRRYALTSPARRPTTEQLITELRVHPDAVPAVERAIAGMNRDLDLIWEDAGLIASDTPINPSRAAQIVQRLERTRTLRELVLAGRVAGISAVALGAGAYVLNSRLPYAEGLVEAHRRIAEHIETFDTGTEFFIEMLAAGTYPGAYRKRFSMGTLMDYSITMAHLLQEMETNSSPNTDWTFFSEAFPDERTRINIIMAVFLSLASHGRLDSNPLAVTSLRTPVFNLATRLSELSEAGVDLSAMGLSDFFFLAENYIGCGGETRVRVEGAEGAEPYSMDRIDYAWRFSRSASTLVMGEIPYELANPQSARVIAAAAYYASENDLDINWVLSAINNIITAVRPEQIEYWSAEMMYAMFADPSFQKIVQITDIAERSQALVNLWLDIGRRDQRFPWDVYYPEEIRAPEGTFSFH